MFQSFKFLEITSKSFSVIQTQFVKKKIVISVCRVVFHISHTRLESVTRSPSYSSQQQKVLGVTRVFS
jgi:hypothetical protein